VTHLDYDHRKGENVRLLTVFFLYQHLRRSPSYGVAALMRTIPRGTRVFGDLREAKIGDACAAGAFHEDVRLVGCQRGVKRDGNGDVPLLSHRVSHRVNEGSRGPRRRQIAGHTIMHWMIKIERTLTSLS